MLLLRHGQSYFNLHFNKTRVDPGIEDPELTDLGFAQAHAAAARLAQQKLTRIIISPYMRALQTALYRFEGSINKISVDEKGVSTVAVFGTPPHAHADDPARAVLAASGRSRATPSVEAWARWAAEKASFT